MIEIVFADSWSAPMYVQIADAIRQGIENQLLLSGSKLPATRPLADQLGVERKTVMAAYKLLATWRLIEISPGKPPIVRSQPTLTVDSEDAPKAVQLPRSPFVNKLLQTNPVIILSGFNSAALASEDLPLEQWKRAITNTMTPAAASMETRDSLGYKPLRVALQAELAKNFGLRCDVCQLALFCEPRNAIDATAKMILTPGDNVVMESPGSRWARRIFKTCEANIIHIPIDEDGISSHALNQLEDPVRLIYLTPTHHDPTGSVLSLTRRREILEWAERKDVVIIEDHTDCHFRYTSPPIPPLFSLAKEARVVFISSLWKVMFPLVKIGYAVFPADAMRGLHSLCALSTNDSLSWLEQHALVDFIATGKLNAHIDTLQMKFTSRRFTMIHALKREFGDSVQISKESAGMQQYIRLDLHLPQESVLECALKAQLLLISMASFYQDGHSQNEYLLPFALMTEESLEEKIRYFAALIRAQANHN